MSIPLESLPPPHELTIVDGSVVLQPSQTMLPRAHVADEFVRPRRFRARWLLVRVEVAGAILRHFYEHADRVISWHVPQLGGPVRVQWSDPPQIAFGSGVTATNVTAEFDEILAFNQ